VKPCQKKNLEAIIHKGKSHQICLNIYRKHPSLCPFTLEGEFDMKISFHGAAQDVTGSCHLVECAGKRVLIDCGLYQGGRKLEKENREELIPLSQERADFIVEQLVNRGIERETLTAEGKGGANPIASRRDRANWWKNRRIEFLIKK